MGMPADQPIVTVAEIAMQSPNSNDSMAAGLLTARRLTTSDVAEGERFAFWVDMIRATYVWLEAERPDDRPTFGEIESSRLGTLDLTQVRANVPVVRRTHSHVHRDAQDYCLVHVQRRGRAVVTQDGRVAALMPGDFTVYETSRPYELRFDDAMHEVVVLRMARAELEPHVVNLEELTATTVPGTCAAGNLLLTMIDTLQRDIDRLHPSSAMGVSEGITSIVAAGLRALPGANVQRPSSLYAYHIARVKKHVMDNLRDPELSIGKIAASVGLSADHLSRMFRNEPVPLSRLIWQQRLDACRRDLCDPRLAQRTVSEIAFAWGFSDAAHFSRSFREQFGVSPREWRQLQSP